MSPRRSHFDLPAHGLHGEQRSFREDILYDENYHVAITIWENLLEEISEETMYLFQNNFLKTFYGLKLATTRATIVSSERAVPFTLPQDAVTIYMELNKQLRNRLHPKICCPEVVSVTLDVFPGCINIACGRPVVAILDQPSTSCQQCNTTINVRKCPCIFHCTLAFEDMEKPLNYRLKFYKAIYNRMKLNCAAKKILSHSLLFIEKVDYFYNTKNVITHTKKHGATLFSSLNFTYKIYFLQTYYI